jgi:predicted  nucleic acid-binding Zn-ribbon protein
VNRCPDCGGFFFGDECPYPHTDDRDERQAVVEQAVEEAPYAQGDWVAYEATIGTGHAEERIVSPAQVLGVSSGKVRLACYVAKAGRVVILDAPLGDVLPPTDTLEESDDGD